MESPEVSVADDNAESVAASRCSAGKLGARAAMTEEGSAATNRPTSRNNGFLNGSCGFLGWIPRYTKAISENMIQRTQLQELHRLVGALAMFGEVMGTSGNTVSI
jgi:hypothetical protein